jgi:predicted RNA-binding protein with PUA-like domain
MSGKDDGLCRARGLRGMADVSLRRDGGWLFKQEPDCYSFADLERDRETLWDGVSNNLALKNLRDVRAGDRVFFYETGKVKAVVGEMRVAKGPMPDPAGDNPKRVVVTVAAVKRLPRPVTLAEIKADPKLEGWDLVRNSRLSVMRVNAEQWQRLTDMSRASP